MAVIVDIISPLCCKVNRDSAILVFQEKGPACRFKVEDMLSNQKKVVAAAREVDDRLKTGEQLEKSVFLERFKDRPEVLKAARFFPARVRDEITGRWTIEQHCKVYDQGRGAYRFEERFGKELRREEIIDDLEFEFMQDQDKRSFEDHAELMFEGNQGKRMLKSDVNPSSSSHDPSTDGNERLLKSDVNPSASKKQREEKKQAGKEEETDEDEGDDLSPMEKMMAASELKPAQKTKKEKGSPAPSHAAPKGRSAAVKKAAAAGGGGLSLPSGAGKTDGVVAALMAETQRELTVFKELQKLEDGCEEALSSLAGRIQSKRLALSKKVSKKAGGGALDTLDQLTATRTRLVAMVDTVKSILKFDRQVSRKTAAIVEDKYAVLLASGVSLDMLPVNVTIAPLEARCCILSADLKWRDISNVLSTDHVRKHAPALSDERLEAFQQKVVTRALVSYIRSLDEAKDSDVHAVTKFSSLATHFADTVLENRANLLDAIKVVISNKAVSASESCKAPTV